MYEGYQQEKEPVIKVETFSRENFIDQIYTKEDTIDPRFLRIQDGGVFKYFDPAASLDSSDKIERFFPTVALDETIVALAQLDVRSQNAVIKFVSVDEEYTGNHYASKLIEEIFRFAKEKGYSLEASSYTNIGYEKLKRVCNKMSKKYSVVFEDTEDRVG